MSTPTSNQRKFLKKLSSDGTAGYTQNNNKDRSNNKKKKPSRMAVNSNDFLSNTIGSGAGLHHSYTSKTPSHASRRQVVSDRLFKTGNPNVSS